MKKIDLSLPPTSLSLMVYGPTRAGKTRFAGGFPKPRFLSDLSEKGYETLRTMPSSALFDPNIKPEVWGIERPQDMLQALQETADEVAQKKPTAPLTLVIDSITYYSTLYYDSIEKLEPPNKPPDGRKLYGMLLNHLRRILIRAHEIPINVVWLALDTEPDESGQGGISVAGKSRKILPAACQYYFYMRAVPNGPGGTVKHEVRTRQYGINPAGGRDGGILPDPLPEPTYRSLMECLRAPAQGVAAASK